MSLVSSAEGCWAIDVPGDAVFPTVIPVPSVRYAASAKYAFCLMRIHPEIRHSGPTDERTVDRVARFSRVRAQEGVHDAKTNAFHL